MIVQNKLEPYNVYNQVNTESLHPCSSCDVGWGTVSAIRSITCHDGCPRLRDYKESLKELEGEKE